MAQLMYDATAAAGYERGFARVSSHFVPFLLQAADISAGHSVLDVATGTGLAAEAALGDHRARPDTSRPRTFHQQMAERARERLNGASKRHNQGGRWSGDGLPDEASTR